MPRWLGSARVSRAGERVLAIANFRLARQYPARKTSKEEFVSARRINQHARRVRYPDTHVKISRVCATFFEISNCDARFMFADRASLRCEESDQN
jgi:hypothetical protein